MAAQVDGHSLAAGNDGHARHILQQGNSAAGLGGDSGSKGGILSIADGGNGLGDNVVVAVLLHAIALCEEVPIGVLACTIRGVKLHEGTALDGDFCGAIFPCFVNAVDKIFVTVRLTVGFAGEMAIVND